MNFKNRTGLLALLFILFWSSGAIFAKIGLAYTEPFTFLAIRLAVATLLLFIISWITQAPWPKSWQAAANVIITGILVQAFYQIGCFYSLYENVSPGILALVLGGQPILTAIICRFFFKDKISAQQWIGLILGFLGLTLVTENAFFNRSITLKGFLFLMLALVGITFGSIYQKARCHVIDLRTSCVIQNGTSAILLILFAMNFESMSVDWQWPFLIAMFWMVIMNSIGAVLIFYYLLNQGNVTKISSLFYLMPPITGLMDYFIFGDKFSSTALFGMVIITMGIVLVNNNLKINKILNAIETK